jgi:hypothetical protein
MITLEQLHEMFEGIAQGPAWDMTQPMLWGYFFTDESHEKLAALVPGLEQQGYRFVDLYEPELEEGEEPYWFLHVEKEEAHSPESLHARNAEFYALADEHDLLSYDGMDVGPLEPGVPTH